MATFPNPPVLEEGFSPADGQVAAFHAATNTWRPVTPGGGGGGSAILTGHGSPNGVVTPPSWPTPDLYEDLDASVLWYSVGPANNQWFGFLLTSIFNPPGLLGGSDLSFAQDQTDDGIGNWIIGWVSSRMLGWGNVQVGAANPDTTVNTLVAVTDGTYEIDVTFTITDTAGEFPIIALHKNPLGGNSTLFGPLEMPVIPAGPNNTVTCHLHCVVDLSANDEVCVVIRKSTVSGTGILNNDGQFSMLGVH